LDECLVTEEEWERMIKNGLVLDLEEEDPFADVILEEEEDEEDEWESDEGEEGEEEGEGKKDKKSDIEQKVEEIIES